MASGDHADSRRYLFPQITAVCSVPDRFAEARSLSQASTVIWPWRWTHFPVGGEGGASPCCLTLAKTQTRSQLKDPFIIMDLAFSTQAPPKSGSGSKRSVKVNKPSRPAASHASPDERLGRKHIYSTLASWGNIHHFPLKRSSAGIYRLTRAIFFLSVSGGGAADDDRLRERGQPLRHGRSLLGGEVSNDSRSCVSQMDRHAT